MITPTPRPARWPATAVVLLGVLVGGAAAAAAAPPPTPTPTPPPVDVRAVPEGAEVTTPGGTAPAADPPPAAPEPGDAAAPAPGPRGGPGPAPVAPTTTYSRVPDCAGNAPGGAAQGNLCNGAILTCAGPGQVRYRLYSRPAADPVAAWAFEGTQCLTDAELATATAPGGAPAGAAPVVVTQADLRRLPFAAGTSLLQPPGGQALVNVPLHVHGAAQVQVLPTVVAGAAVQVRATPTAYAWDFGDGATAGPSPDPGAPWPAQGHEHAYAAPGARAVTMSTTYTGEFSVAGGPWQPIDGDVTIVSPAQPVLARTARASLVGDLLG